MKLKFIFSFAALLFISYNVAKAQPGGGGPGGGGDPDAPITGVEILLIAGGVLGVKKLINSRKNTLIK